MILKIDFDELVVEIPDSINIKELLEQLKVIFPGNYTDVKLVKTIITGGYTNPWFSPTTVFPVYPFTTTSNGNIQSQETTNR